MEEKYNEATKNRPEGDRQIDAPVLVADLPDLIKQLRKEKAWDRNDRNAITVFKSSKMRIVLVAMHRKATMRTDRPENILSLQVIKGKVKLETPEESFVISRNQLVAVHENIDYNIISVKKSVFLLTIAE